MTPLDLSHLSWQNELKDKVQTALDTSRVPLVREALAQISSLPDFEQAAQLKVGIVRSFTVETQLDFINLALSTIPSRPAVQVGEFAGFETVLWDPRSEILASGPDAILVLWRLEDLYPDLVDSFSTWSYEKRKETADSIVKRVADLCHGFSKVSDAPLFLSTMPDLDNQRLSDLHLKCSLKSIKYLVNQQILELASEDPQIFVFDFAGWCAKEGQSCFDERFDLFAKQPISSASIGSFALALTSTLRPLLKSRAKVLVLDLDNTLWGGTLGEDGQSNLKIGRDYPGNVYRQIQLQVKQLKHKGILLALASKNDVEPVKEAFATMPEMVLAWDDFVCTKVDWNSKHQNIKAIADQLQLGLDSFVFLDDNHLEREEIRHYLPEVQVLSITEEPLSILRAIKSCGLFDSYRLSDEDYKRSELYALQKSRAVDAHESNVDGFLLSLEMLANVQNLSPSTLPRAVQMLQKTNQFNLTTRRHNEARVREWTKSGRNVLLTIELEDRFGSHGIVGLLIALEQEPKTLLVDSFLLSCRVIGRGVEDAFWSTFVQRAGQMGYERIVAQYIATEKNRMVADLFVKLGMTETEVLSNEHIYEIQLPARAPIPPWFRVKVNDYDKDYEQSGTAV